MKDKLLFNSKIKNKKKSIFDFIFGITAAEIEERVHIFKSAFTKSHTETTYTVRISNQTLKMQLLELFQGTAILLKDTRCAAGPRSQTDDLHITGGSAEIPPELQPLSCVMQSEVPIQILFSSYHEVLHKMMQY